MVNPGNPTPDDLRKENVGIRTRHGLTYGKYRAKIRFPKIMSEDHVWNGVTCAFWLKYQEGSWNQRSNCESGYNPKLYLDKESSNTSIYSEIAIEIVKTSKYWSVSSYADKSNIPVDDALNGNLTLTCTNWDLACHDADSFNIGVKPIEYEGQEYRLHRWHDRYRALTAKYEYPHDKLMGQDVYFEIDWQPNCIIWRVGKDPDRMKVFGYMKHTNTMVPDNQMELVFTQEYHLAEWWPLTPFQQDFIPYPLHDLKGYIYEVVVE